MKSKFLKKKPLILRSFTLFYTGLLIFLPLAAVINRTVFTNPSAIIKSITNPQALSSIKLSITTSLIIMVINVITGTFFAWVLVRYNFPFKRVIDSLTDLPFAIPTVVTGMMLVVIYGPDSFLGRSCDALGIQILYSKPGIILALVFITFPFVVRSVQPVLLEMGKDMEEAAKSLGASDTTIFFRITLPVLFRSILTGAALSFSRAVGEFGSVVIVAGNIPFKTQTASVYIYGEMESSNITGALSVALVLLLISFITLCFLNKIKNRGSEKAV